MNSPFQFRLPKSFHPAEFLRTPKLLRLADDARYFVSLILTKLARRDVDECGHVRLMAKHLRNVMNFRNYSAVVDALLDGGAVTRAPYQVGERSFGYRLAERFRAYRHVRIPATDPRLIARLAAFHEQAEQERRSRMKPVHYGLERHQFRLRIDGNLAREIIAGLSPTSNPFDVQGILVSDIEHRDFRVNVGRFGRLSNNVTSMKRELRAALMVGGQSLQHVDISCCQPALIGRAARAGQQAGREQGEGNKGGDTGVSIYDVQDTTPRKSDLDVYCDLVQSGRFYDFMLSQLKTQSCLSFTRDELKRRFLADVAAKRKANRRGAEYPSDVEDCFRELFPSVYRFIRHVNRDGWQHANLIRQLQRDESKLVIETVAADLVAQHPEVFALTLHDSVFATARCIPIVVGAFEAAFDQIGYPMSLKVA